MEIKTELGLENNSLNDLDNENENDDHVSEPIPPTAQAEPVEAKEFFLLELPDGFKVQLGSVRYTAIELSNQGYAIYQDFKNKKGGVNETKNKSYLG